MAPQSSFSLDSFTESFMSTSEVVRLIAEYDEVSSVKKPETEPHPNDVVPITVDSEPTVVDPAPSNHDPQTVDNETTAAATTVDSESTVVDPAPSNHDPQPVDNATTAAATTITSSSTFPAPAAEDQITEIKPRVNEAHRSNDVVRDPSSSRTVPSTAPLVQAAVQHITLAAVQLAVEEAKKSTSTAFVGRPKEEVQQVQKRQKRNEDESGKRPDWLLEGWKVLRRVRLNGATKGVIDTYYVEPQPADERLRPKKFRSKKEVLKYLKKQNPTSSIAVVNSTEQKEMTVVNSTEQKEMDAAVILTEFKNIEAPRGRGGNHKPLSTSAGDGNADGDAEASKNREGDKDGDVDGDGAASKNGDAGRDGVESQFRK